MRRSVLAVLCVGVVVGVLAGCSQENPPESAIAQNKVSDDLKQSPGVQADLRFAPSEYPKVDSSTSAWPLQAFIACRLTGEHPYWFVQDPIDQTWMVLPLKKVPKDWDGRTESAAPAAAHRRVYSELPEGADADMELLKKLEPSGTHGAWVNLIEGRKDLILVARPASDDEKRLAKDKGVELETYPVALDAFVFMVHKGRKNMDSGEQATENPVEDLSLGQIRKIFAGQITNWKDVGGPDWAIRPYLRNANSGSQETLERLVMEGQRVGKFPDIAMPMSMIGPFNAIRHVKQGIGFTFFYYDRKMARVPETKLIAVNGVQPTPETIADGSYPLVTRVYAAIRADAPADADVRKVLAWIRSPAGQRTVAESGYVPLKTKN